MAETAQSLMLFTINIYLQNHAQNWIFGPPYWGTRGNINTLSELFNTKESCSRVSLKGMSVLLVKQRIGISEPPFWGFRVMYAIHL